MWRCVSSACVASGAPSQTWQAAENVLHLARDCLGEAGRCRAAQEQADLAKQGPYPLGVGLRILSLSAQIGCGLRQLLLLLLSGAVCEDDGVIDGGDELWVWRSPAGCAGGA